MKPKNLLESFEYKTYDSSGIRENQNFKPSTRSESPSMELKIDFASGNCADCPAVSVDNGRPASTVPPRTPGSTALVPCACNAIESKKNPNTASKQTRAVAHARMREPMSRSIMMSSPPPSITAGGDRRRCRFAVISR